MNHRQPRTGLGANPVDYFQDTNIYDDDGFDDDEFENDDYDANNMQNSSNTTHLLASKLQHALNNNPMSMKKGNKQDDDSDDHDDYLEPDPEMSPEKVRQSPSFRGRAPPPIPVNSGRMSVPSRQQHSQAPPPLPARSKQTSEDSKVPPGRGNRPPPPLPQEKDDDEYYMSPAESNAQAPPLLRRNLPPPPDNHMGYQWDEKPPSIPGRIRPPVPPPTDEETYEVPQQELSRLRLNSIQDDENEDVYLAPQSGPEQMTETDSHRPLPTFPGSRLQKENRSSISSRSSTGSDICPPPPVPSKINVEPPRPSLTTKNPPSSTGRAKLPTPTDTSNPQGNKSSLFPNPNAKKSKPPPVKFNQDPPQPPQEEYNVIAAVETPGASHRTAPPVSQRLREFQEKNVKPWKFQQKNPSPPPARKPLPEPTPADGEVYEMFEDQPDKISGGSISSQSSRELPQIPDRPRKTSTSSIGSLANPNEKLRKTSNPGIKDGGGLDINTQVLRGVKLKKTARDVFTERERSSSCSSVISVHGRGAQPSLPDKSQTSSNSPQIGRRGVPKLPHTTQNTPVNSPQINKKDSCRPDADQTSHNDDENNSKSINSIRNKFESQGKAKQPIVPWPKEAKTKPPVTAWKKPPKELIEEKPADRDSGFQSGSAQVFRNNAPSSIKDRKACPLPSTPSAPNIDDCSWFHRVLDKDTTQERLDTCKKYGSCPNGAFLVRTSRKGGPNNPYTLCLMYSSMLRLLHIRKRHDDKYALGEFKTNEQTFTTVPELIEYHHSNPIIIAGNKGGETILTGHPKRP